MKLGWVEQKIKYVYVLLFVVIFFYSSNIYCQDSTFLKEDIRIAYLKKKSTITKKQDFFKKKVIICIHKSFNDTLLFMLNGQMVGKYFFNTDTLTSSSNFSGRCISIKVTKRKNIFGIYLLKEKRYVSFVLEHKRPFYTLHRLNINEKNRYFFQWYLNGLYTWF